MPAHLCASTKRKRKRKWKPRGCQRLCCLLGQCAFTGRGRRHWCLHAHEASFAPLCRALRLALVPASISSLLITGYAMLGRHARLRSAKLAARAFRLARELGDKGSVNDVGIIAKCEAMAAIAQGDFAETAARAQEALRGYDRLERNTLHILLATAAMLQGQFAHGLTYLSAVRESVQIAADFHSQLWALLLTSHVHFLLGDRASASAEIKRCEIIVDESASVIDDATHAAIQCNLALADLGDGFSTKTYFSSRKTPSSPYAPLITTPCCPTTQYAGHSSSSLPPRRPGGHQRLQIIIQRGRAMRHREKVGTKALAPRLTFEGQGCGPWELGSDAGSARGVPKGSLACGLPTGGSPAARGHADMLGSARAILFDLREYCEVFRAATPMYKCLISCFSTLPTLPQDTPGASGKRH